MCSPKRVGREHYFDSVYGKLMKKYKTMWILSVAAIFVSVALQNYTVNQYVRAVLKLTAMQLIDLNNFKNLLHDSCLIYKNTPKLRELIESDCYSCETIDRVDFVHKPEDILESYSELDWPVEYQSDVKTNVTVKDVALALLTGDLLPCDYESNLKIDPLRAIEMKSGWFMHWRNCDDIQGKIMRSLYRPDLFLSISSKTWTIMSFKYKTVHYKKINMYYESRVAVSQISGTFKYRLVPKSRCTKICNNLEGRLETYHTLVFNNFLWDFQYLPLNNPTNSITIIYYLD